jgi:hypothetical protein
MNQSRQKEIPDCTLSPPASASVIPENEKTCGNHPAGFSK